jgi:hypothetical protein
MTELECKYVIRFISQFNEGIAIIHVAVSLTRKSTSVVVVIEISGIVQMSLPIAWIAQKDCLKDNSNTQGRAKVKKTPITSQMFARATFSILLLWSFPTSRYRLAPIWMPVKLPISLRKLPSVPCQIVIPIQAIVLC